MTIDIEDWLAPIEGDNPSGVDLRNDRRFLAIEALMQPQVEVVRDDANNPVSHSAVPVEWDEVLKSADELRKEGRDIRLLVIVTRALANESGFEGLANGLTLIAKTLGKYWDNVHPALREGRAPRDAAMRRTNALMDLQNDDDGLLGDLEQHTWLSPRGVGPITGHDLYMGMLSVSDMLNEAASGLGVSEKQKLSSEHENLVKRVKAGCTAFADQETDEMDKLKADLKAAQDALTDVEAALKTALEADITFPELKQFMTRVGSTLNSAKAPAAAEEEGEAPVTNVTAPEAAAQSNGAQPAAGGGAIPGKINSRKEVEKCLDLIIEFYERTEPSSPIPHIARRLRRMVPMDFLELIQEIAPGGMKEFKSNAGIDEKK